MGQPVNSLCWLIESSMTRDSLSSRKTSYFMSIMPGLQKKYCVGIEITVCTPGMLKSYLVNDRPLKNMRENLSHFLLPVVTRCFTGKCEGQSFINNKFPSHHQTFIQTGITSATAIPRRSYKYQTSSHGSGGSSDVTLGPKDPTQVEWYGSLVQKGKDWPSSSSWRLSVLASPVCHNFHRP